MKLDLKGKISKISSQAALASRLGCKQQTVSLWMKNSVPANNVLDLCAALEWQITPHEVRPDLYPNPNDGLPIEPQAATEV
ncbi:Cro/Cl family transcriptional regulator [Salmonella enterica subsp. salamae]|nr:helix-turn-helix domain-containing protein [Salmonella enterica subsp. salamae]ECI4077178.1 Cro/Cl family transcriptional regulator [Salmonella enterica subsp. salamae]EEO2381464.1 helix-turn-helix domain-containing protein [Salmonella enterica]